MIIIKTMIALTIIHWGKRLHRCGTSMVFLGTWSTNGGFLTSMLVYQRVCTRTMILHKKNRWGLFLNWTIYRCISVNHQITSIFLLPRGPTVKASKVPVPVRSGASCGVGKIWIKIYGTYGEQTIWTSSETTEIVWKRYHRFWIARLANEGKRPNITNSHHPQ